MLAFIAANLGSLLVLLALVTVVTTLIVLEVRQKRRGESSCGSGCASCPMAGACHKKEK